MSYTNVIAVRNWWNKAIYMLFFFTIFFGRYISLKDALKVFNDFNNKQKKVWSNVFWYVKVCIFSKCI